MFPDICFCPVQDIRVTFRWLWPGPTEEQPTAGARAKQMSSQKL